MRKEEFTIASRDGVHQLHSVKYLPEGAPKGIVVIVHGMAEHLGRYEAFAEFLTERGFLVAGEDHLGHGQSVPEGETYGYFCQMDPATVLMRDVHRLKKTVQNEYPGDLYFGAQHGLLHSAQLYMPLRNGYSGRDHHGHGPKEPACRDLYPGFVEMHRADPRGKVLQPHGGKACDG